MDVQNPNQINNSTQPNQNSQTSETIQAQSPSVLPQQIPIAQQVVDNTPVEPVKKKSKGCLSILLIVFVSFLVLCLILALTTKVWYVPLFKAIFPEESNSSLYLEPQKRGVFSSSGTQDWTEISINQGTIAIPLGEIVNRVDEGNGDYSYDFANGDLVYVMPTNYSSSNSNYKMRESCLINMDYFDNVKTLPQHIGLSMILVSKTFLLNQGGWSSIPYYYENSEVFVCQMGNISNTEEESSINLIIIPSSEDPELESTYTQLLLFSSILTQEDIDKIVGSIVFD